MKTKTLNPLLFASLVLLTAAPTRGTQTLFPAGTILSATNNYSWERMTTINVDSGQFVPFVTYQFNTFGGTAGTYTFSMNAAGFPGAINVYAGQFDPTAPLAGWYQDGTNAFNPGTIAQSVFLPANQLFEVVFSGATNGSSGTFSATVNGPTNLTLMPVTNATIRVNPQSQTIVLGTNADLQVYAAGTLPHTFQWYRGVRPDTNSPIASATSAKYITPGLTASTSYWVRVTGPGVSNFVNSSTAVITVSTNPNGSYSNSLTAGGCQLQNGDYYATQGFEIEESGNYTFTLTPGFTLAIYAGSFDPLQPLMNYWGPANGFYAPGDYIAVISRSSSGSFSGTISGGPAIVNLLPALPPQIISSPSDTTILTNQTATLSVSMTCGTNFSLQWYGGNSGDTSHPISGASGSSYTTPPLNTTSNYWVRMKWDTGTNDSAAATVYVVTSPITRTGFLDGCQRTYNRPSAAGVLSGLYCPYQFLKFKPSVAGSYTFSTTTSAGLTNRSTLYGAAFDPSNPLLSLYALTNSSNPLTATLLANNTYYLVISSSTPGESGSYTTTVNGPALITLKPVPVITAMTTNQIISRTQSTSFTVSCPTTNVTYQWYTGTVCTARSPVPGATSTNYTTPVLTANLWCWLEMNTEGGYLLSPTMSALIRPVIVNDTNNTVEDMVLIAPGVLNNDIKADNVTLGVTSYTQPANGTVVVQTNGVFTYNPATNFNGTDSFTYQMGDAYLNALGSGTVTINVPEVNDPPVKTSGTLPDLTEAEDSPLTLLSQGTLDYSPGGGADEAPQTLIYRVTAVPVASLGKVYLSDGVTVVTTNTTYSLVQLRGFGFKPVTNAFGTGTFTFTVTDNGTTGGTSDPKILMQSVNINVYPVADTPSITSATTYESSQTTNGLVISRNPEDGAEVGFFQITGITNGTLYLNDGTTVVTNSSFVTVAQGNGGLKFSPTPGLYNPSATFGFTIQASTNNSVSGLGGNTVSAVVAVNPLPAVATTLPAADLTPFSATLNGSVSHGHDNTTWYFQYGPFTNYGNSTPVRPLNNGLLFDGATQSAQTLNSVALSNSSFTIEFWMRRDGSDRFDIAVNHGTAIPQELHIGFRPENVFSFEFWTDTHILYVLGTDNAWHHWACTYNRTNNQRVIYRDGIGAASDIAGSPYVGSGPLRFGRIPYHLNFLMQGGLDEVRVWDVARSQADIAAQMNASLSGNEAGLLGVWAMNEGIGAVAADGTPNANASSLSNAPLWISDRPFSETITGLDPGTLYHFRLVASNSIGTSTGADVTFTTPAALPLVTTLAATSVAPNSAILNGIVNPRGATTTWYFEYGPTVAYGNATPHVTSTTNVTVNAPISGLLPGLTYHFRLVGSNSVGAVLGNDVMLLTPGQTPTVQTLPATNITFTSATVNGSASANGGATRYWFEYGTTTNFDSTSATNFLPPHTSVLRFNGANQHITTAQSLNLSNQSFTVEAWVRRAGINRNDYFLQQGSNGVANRALTFGWRANDRFAFAFWNNDLQTSTPQTDTNWHHWAGTFDAVTRARVLYRDGVVVASDTSSVVYQGDGTITLARSPGAGNWFGGDLSEVRLWSAARSAVGVANGMNFSMTGAEPGLLACWRLNDGSGLIGADASTNANHATLVNAPAWFTPDVQPADLTGLAPGTSYYFRLIAANSAGTTVANDLTFATLPVPTPQISGFTALVNGASWIAFTNVVGAPFTIIATTNLALPLSSWSVLGSAVEGPPGQYQFTDLEATNYPARFYNIRSP